MARPVVSPTTEDLYASLGAYTAGDEERDWPLLKFCAALADTFAEPVAELVSERDGRVPWEVLFDPALCPVEYLAYLAQYVGVELEPDLTEAEQRAKIALPEGFSRGTPEALIAAVQRTLTGAKTIHLDERYTGAAYKLRVRTLATETPSATATEVAVRTQKPVGTVLTYGAITGQDWNDLVADHATWTAVVADYDTWAEVPLDLP